MIPSKRFAAPWGLALCLTFSVSAAAQSEQDDDDDLDDLSDAALQAALEAELDDIFEDQTPPDTEAELVDEFIEILHDEGDADDKEESVISWDELEDEMAEAHTTVRTVVADAVHAALLADSARAPEEHPQNAWVDSLPVFGREPGELGFSMSTIRSAYNGVLAALFQTIDGSDKAK